MIHLLLAFTVACVLAAAPPSGEPTILPPGPSTPPPAIAPAPAAPPAAPATAGELPSAAEIFKRSVAAVGGEDAVRRHTCMRVQGRLSAKAMGMEGPMQILMLAPNRYLTTIDMPGLGRMEQGFDGAVGWSKNPVMGTQLIQGKALEELRRSADFFKDADPARLWSSATTVGITDFAGHRCHEVAVKGDLGEGSLFFDVDGGLHRGMRLSVETPMGKMPTTTRYLEHQAFDGLRVATLSEIEAMGAVQTMSVDRVDFEPLDSKLFEQPADVKALVASGRSAAPPQKPPAGTKPGSGTPGTKPPKPGSGKPNGGAPPALPAGGTVPPPKSP